MYDRTLKKEYTPQDVMVLGAENIVEQLCAVAARSKDRAGTKIFFSHGTMYLSVSPKHSVETVVVSFRKNDPGGGPTEHFPTTKKRATQHVIDESLRHYGITPKHSSAFGVRRSQHAFDTYLPDAIENPDTATTLFPFGSVLQGKPVAVLAALLPSVQLVSLRVLTRLQKHKQNAEVIENLYRCADVSPTLVHLFGDDVMILARTKTGCDYWFFWFDRTDKTDCSIGRFRTNDPISTVIENFNAFADMTSERLSTRMFRSDGTVCEPDPVPSLPVDLSQFSDHWEY